MLSNSTTYLLPHAMAQPDSNDGSLNSTFVHLDNNIMSSFEVKGSYSDPAAGVEIQLPDGWTGMRLGPLGAIISPYGKPFDPGNPDAMIINILELATLKEGPKMTEGFMKSNNLTNPNTSVPKSTTKCSTEKSYVYLNDMIAMHAVTECKDPTDLSKYIVSDNYNVATEDKLISVGLTTHSAQSYQQLVNKFEESIKTLKVRNSVDHRTIWNESLGFKTRVQSIEAKGGKIDAKLQSNSKISNLVFDEAAKKLSFKVRGEDGTLGFTSIPVGKFLQGPYSVAIDGNTIEDFQVVDDRIAGESILEIRYRHSIHDIAITGTNVVPNFLSI